MGIKRIQPKTTLAFYHTCTATKQVLLDIPDICHITLFKNHLHTLLKQKSSNLKACTIFYSPYKTTADIVEPMLRKNNSPEGRLGSLSHTFLCIIVTYMRP
jgi:hypothetical protein